MNKSTTEHTKKSLIIIAVVHNDVPESTRKTIYADYFYPVVSELESFTGRKVNVVFAKGDPQSAFDYKAYKGDARKATLQKWESLGSSLRNEMSADGLETDNLTKIILLTKDGLNSEAAGAALQSGRVAMASLVSYNTVGHEIGHMLGARHEDAEVQYKNGWWAETYMYPNPELIRSNAYAFSAANRQHILNYLAGWP